MSTAVAVRIDRVRTLGFASISGTYAQVGTSLTHMTRIMKLTNNTNGDMYFAFTSSGSTPASDGTADNIFVPAGGFTLYDFSANPTEDGRPFCFSINTSVWVRQSSAPSSGSVYVECVYGKGE